MKNWIIVNKETKEIMAKYEALTQLEFGGAWGSDAFANIEVPAELDPDCLAISNEMELSEDSEKAADKLDASREAKLEQLRQMREPKLARVDQLVNIAFLDGWTAGEKTELKNYRLALLNITEDFKSNMALLDDQDLNEIEWPEEPSES